MFPICCLCLYHPDPPTFTVLSTSHLYPIAKVASLSFSLSQCFLALAFWTFFNVTGVVVRTNISTWIGFCISNTFRTLSLSWCSSQFEFFLYLQAASRYTFFFYPEQTMHLLHAFVFCCRTPLTFYLFHSVVLIHSVPHIPHLYLHLELQWNNHKYCILFASSSASPSIHWWTPLLVLCWWWRKVRAHTISVVQCEGEPPPRVTPIMPSLMIK